MMPMPKRLILKVTFIAFCLLSGRGSYAQVLAPDVPRNRYLLLTEEQYQEGHYALAIQSANQYLSQFEQFTGEKADKVYAETATDIDKAKYYLAMSLLKTDVAGSKDLAVNTMDVVLNPAYRQRLAFTLAQYYFHHHDLAKAVPLYESAGINNLDNTEIADAKFELAYCYFTTRQFDKAEPLFLSIKELKDGKYYMAGNYYYGLLLYNQDKFKESLQSFEKVKDTKEYKAIVPYYIAEIYYFMGNRERALRIADSLMQQPEKSFYDKELHLLEAQCLFEQQHYSEARPYFEFYYSRADKIKKQDLYEMAYCDYRTNAWKDAIVKFKDLSSSSDSLGQTAMYLLGDCYLKTGNKPGARTAFGICADMTYNKGQQESSMILYAKLSYETGNDDEALRQLNNLLKTFPRTKYKDEANTLISGLLVKTNQYDEALNHLEKVGKKEHDYWQVFQQANYGVGVEEFRNGDLKSALSSFNVSLEHPVSADYESVALFWKGEIAYHLHHYEDVITYSQEFLTKKGNDATTEQISPQATTQHAYLNMGFAAMESHDYSGAQSYFNHAQQDRTADKYSGMVAVLREADAVFMQKNFSRAITLYDKIIASGNDDADYAKYQKSIILGLMGKNSEKIALLESLIVGVPTSAYANHARYEAAVTYLESDKYTQALNYLKQLTGPGSDRSFAPQAWMKTGFIYQQMNDAPKAIDAYTHVVRDYPGADERLPALDALRSLYIQSNQPAAYTQLLKDNNLPSAENGSVDSTYYAAAETQFSNGKWESAKVAFSSYLKEYPNGVFAIKAHYYRAESNFQMKQYKEALEDYSIILAGPWNEFFENSARHAAAIAYDQKDYAGAYKYYSQLKDNASNDQTREIAYYGLVKSGFNADKFTEVNTYADSVLAERDITEETKNDVLYYKARSLQHFDKADGAIAVYKQLSTNKNGNVAAESRYHIAELLYKQDKLKEAEDAANETIHLSAGYDYWIVKSYLLLADVLVKQKDYFNAKATLQSIVKHAKIEELKQEAAKKLDEVKLLEKPSSKLDEE